jgi:hypothetical protein
VYESIDLHHCGIHGPPVSLDRIARNSERNNLIDAKFGLDLWGKTVWLSTSYAPTSTSSPPQVIFDTHKPPKHVKEILERFKVSSAGNQLVFVIIEVPYVGDTVSQDPGLKIIKTDGISQHMKKKSKQNMNTKKVKKDNMEESDSGEDEHLDVLETSQLAWLEEL